MINFENTHLFKLMHRNLLYRKIINWLKLIAVTSSTQLAVQAAGLFGGIFIIRFFSIQEYAYYTIANTALGTMTLLSDGGISNGVMARGGRIWQDKDELGIVLVTGLELRKKFASITLFIGVPSLFYLLIHQGASWLTSILIISAIVPAFIANLSDSLLEVAPKLHQNIKPLQTNQLLVSIIRLLLNILSVITLPVAYVALLANSLPRVYGNIKLKIITKEFANLNQLPSIKENRAILDMTKKVLPLVIFYSVSSQITLWMLSLFGNSGSIAQIGALGRLTVFISLIGTILSILVLPRFARIPFHETKKIIFFFTLTQIFLLTLSVLIVFSAWILSPYILSILGKKYANLSNEFMLSVISSCLMLIESATGNMLNSRGLIISPFIIILINLSSLIISLYIFNLRTLNGVLKYNILMNTIFYFVLILFSYLSLKITDKQIFQQI